MDSGLEARCRKAAQQDEAALQGRTPLHLVVLGHVDAGKSTLMGRLLHELGWVLAGAAPPPNPPPSSLQQMLALFAVYLDRQTTARVGLRLPLRRTRSPSPPHPLPYSPFSSHHCDKASARKVSG